MVVVVGAQSSGRNKSGYRLWLSPLIEVSAPRARADAEARNRMGLPRIRISKPERPASFRGLHHNGHHLSMPAQHSYARHPKSQVLGALYASAASCQTSTEDQAFQSIIISPPYREWRDHEGKEIGDSKEKLMTAEVSIEFSHQTYSAQLKDYPHR
ncbi:hypothetical protein PGT21_008066 [Puccinia graminis f. sp. tritici]|uniref:Uncharacterized protein n=1 Tax=Puccinia graminis f. sp. tritici TaxID=56615 RepID=A0A5B0PGC7_PUCGR|nr:hypothetical protein PGT21_008066 [Puccinia graminis f. sp. tritici]KAA1123258.1 hypothetical protein PGTUg99_016747 [Puccinia graminis f. sp. tritici]